MEREMTRSAAAPPPVTWNGVLSWGGILAGFVAGLVSFMILFVFGLCLWIAAMGGGTARFGPLAMWAAIWVLVALGIAAFLGGRTTGAAAGLITPPEGRLNALVTGMLLLLALTWICVSFVSSAVNRVAGLTQSVVSTVGNAAVTAGGGLAQADWSSILQRLGLGDEYQALVSGLSEQQLSRFLAQQAPRLNEQQVAAAVSTVRGAITTAASQVGKNLPNVTDLGQVTRRQADWVQTQLTGPAFVAHLEARGLPPQPAREVEQVIGQRIRQLRAQAQETAASIQRGLDQIGETAAAVAGRIAGLWLLTAAILLGFAMLGGASEGWAPALRLARPAPPLGSRAASPGT